MVQGYHRRRGWLAWHIPMLSRAADLPELDDLMGIEPEELDLEAEAERQLAVLRKWKVADKMLTVGQAS